MALRNRDRLLLIWSLVHDMLATILAPETVRTPNPLVRRAAVGLLRICRRLLHYKADSADALLRSMQMVLRLDPAVAWDLAPAIAEEVSSHYVAGMGDDSHVAKREYSNITLTLLSYLSELQGWIFLMHNVVAEVKISFQVLQLVKSSGKAIKVQHGWRTICLLISSTSLSPEACPIAAEALQVVANEPVLTPSLFMPCLETATAFIENQNTVFFASLHLKSHMNPQSIL